MSAQPPRGYRPLTRTLLIASAGCLLMIALRWLLTGSPRFAFLLWNLFLAWIPYLLCLLIRRVSYPGSASARRRLVAVVLGAGWLLFYPNAPYILTDVIHLIGSSTRSRTEHPLFTGNALLWYDIILHASFAFIGHFIGLISLVILHRIIRDQYRRDLAWGVVVLASGLGGYGIYLGRFERLNSWDILRVPVVALRTGLVNLFNLKAVLFSLCFAFFIFLTYLIVYSFHESAR